ncbi:MAG: phosphatase PAP2 family protein [Candidatus Sulfotelmatobacter sp.]|jgi:hypothetical protein
MAASQNSAPDLSLALRTAAIACLVVLADIAALHLDFRQPFVGYGIGGACLLLLAGRPNWRQVGIVVLAAAMIAFFVVRRIEDAVTLLIQLTGSLGLASLLFLCCKAVWEPRQARSQTFRILLPSCVMTFMIFGSVYSLNMASYLHAKTFDLYTFVFDGSLGFQPSFASGRALAANSWLIPLVRLTYEGIVLAMAAFYAAFMARREKPIWELIELLFAAAMVGYLFFSVFPVCGPRYGFPASFPGANFAYSRLAGLQLQRIPVDWLIPRNGVPSLHFTWALLIWWNTRTLPRWGRAAATAFVLATAFDTMATGEHYLFDLIAALPFALCMQASMVRTVAFRNRERWLPVLCGGAMFLGWLMLCRFGLPLLLQSQFLPWSLALASSVVSIVWAFRLPALIPEMQTRVASRATVEAKVKAAACAS